MTERKQNEEKKDASFRGKKSCSTEGGIHMAFQSFWDKFEQSGSVKAYLDYVKNVKPNRSRYTDDWDDDWDDLNDWDDDDDDYDDD